MSILTYALVLAIICVAVVPAVTGKYYSEMVSDAPSTKMEATITFYLHDTLSGNNPSAVKVAQSSMALAAANNSVPWSSVFVVDDPITEGPDLSSPVLGNALGMYVSSGKTDMALVLYLDIGFNTGKFNGSTFSMFSRNHVADKVREVAVVGGTGRFRGAKGFVLITTEALNFTTGDAVLKYTATLIY